MARQSRVFRDDPRMGEQMVHVSGGSRSSTRHASQPVYGGNARMDGARTVLSWIALLTVFAVVLAVLIKPVLDANADRIQTETQIEREKWEWQQWAFAAEQKAREAAKTQVQAAMGWTGVGTLVLVGLGVGLIVLALGVRAVRVSREVRSVQILPDRSVLVGGEDVYDPRTAYTGKVWQAHEPSMTQGEAIAASYRGRLEDGGRGARAIPADLRPRD